MQKQKNVSFIGIASSWKKRALVLENVSESYETSRKLLHAHFYYSYNLYWRMFVIIKQSPVQNKAGGGVLIKGGSDR